jgi:hypothetical protein
VLTRRRDGAQQSGSWRVAPDDVTRTVRQNRARPKRAWRRVPAETRAAHKRRDSGACRFMRGGAARRRLAARHPEPEPVDSTRGPSPPSSPSPLACAASRAGLAPRAGGSLIDRSRASKAQPRTSPFREIGLFPSMVPPWRLGDVLDQREPIPLPRTRVSPEVRLRTSALRRSAR